MVTRKTAKKTTTAKSVGAKTPAGRKVVGKKVVAKGTSKRSPEPLKIDEASLAEARALLSKRLADGKALNQTDFVTILHLLGEIAHDIQQIIILLTRGS